MNNKLSHLITEGSFIFEPGRRAYANLTIHVALSWWIASEGIAGAHDGHCLYQSPEDLLTSGPHREVKGGILEIRNLRTLLEELFTGFTYCGSLSVPRSEHDLRHVWKWTHEGLKYEAELLIWGQSLWEEGPDGPGWHHERMGEHRTLLQLRQESAPRYFPSGPVREQILEAARRVELIFTEGIR